MALNVLTVLTSQYQGKEPNGVQRRHVFFGICIPVVAILGLVVHVLYQGHSGTGWRF